MTKEPTVKEYLESTNGLDHYNNETIPLILHSDMISKTTSASAWMTTISFSGILTTTFALMCSFDSHPYKIPNWFIAIFFLSVALSSYLFSLNYFATRNIHSNVVDFLMSALNKPLSKFQKESDDKEDTVNTTNTTIIKSENIAIGLIIFQIFMVFISLCLIRLK